MSGFSAGNAQHIGARAEQQDSFGFSDPGDQAFLAHGGFLGIVADGVGGLTHGSQASQSAVNAFLQAYQLKPPGESIPDALVRSLYEANAAVLRVASEPSAEGAGTTFAAAILHASSAYWISAGDSRVYLLRARRLTRLSSDHTYAHELNAQVAQGEISLAEARGNSERGSLTSYLGQPEPKFVDRNLRPLTLRPDDQIIVCSDGFYRALDEPTIIETFDQDLQNACDRAVGQVLAKQRSGQDNLTVIALRQRGGGRNILPVGHRGIRTRLPIYAAVLLVLTALCFAGYRYDKRAASAPTAEKPGTVTGETELNSSPAKTPESKPAENMLPTNNGNAPAAVATPAIAGKKNLTDPKTKGKISATSPVAKTNHQAATKNAKPATRKQKAVPGKQNTKSTTGLNTPSVTATQPTSDSAAHTDQKPDETLPPGSSSSTANNAPEVKPPVQPASIDGKTASPEPDPKSDKPQQPPDGSPTAIPVTKP